MRFTKLTRFFTTPFGIIVALLVVGGVAFAAFSGGDEAVPTATVMRGTVSKNIQVTGTTEPHSSVALAFERGGTVRRVYAQVGDRVSEGARLVELSSSELRGQLTQAAATYASAQANLDELQRGTRPEDVKVKETELQKAQQDLTNDYQSARDTLQDAYAKADDARGKTAGIFSGSKSTAYSVTFTSCDGQAESDASRLRLSIEPMLDAWRTELNTLTASTPAGTLEQALAAAPDRLNMVKDFLKRTNDTLVTGCTANNTAFDTYRTNVNTARTNVNTALTNVTTLSQTIASQKLTVARIADELALKRAGATAEQLAAANAEVQRAAGQVAVVQAQLSAMTLRAPFAGMVTKQDAKVGELASANTPLVSLISEQQFEIEANVPEVEVGNVRVGNPVRITLDAFPGESFTGTITAIDPAETVIDGIANYTTTVQFSEPDPRMKSGLTANLDIETIKKEGVLFLPEIAVLRNNEGTFVRTQTDDGTRDIPVILGIRGNNGVVEILSGVREGDQVLHIVAPTE